VEIEKWEATGVSKTLAPGVRFEFKAHKSRGASIEFARTRGKPFPAKMKMNIFYTVSVHAPGMSRVVDESDVKPFFGSAKAEISSIPPAPWDMFNIDEKGQFTDKTTGIIVIPVACAC
jgi:hypothetical protein